MHQRTGSILSWLVCAILVMPQGWCCWFVPLQCCTTTETKNCCNTTAPESSCCHCKQQTKSDDQPATPWPIQCAKCIHDATKPSFPPAFDLTVVQIDVLPIDALSIPPSGTTNDSTHLHGSSPPLHVQLCVWRC